MDERKILENLNVFQQVKSCSRPDNDGALVMFAKIMTGKLTDSDISIERLAAIYQGITKQIPEAVEIPKDIMTLFPMYSCPVCGGYVHGTEKYCPECGQALDWSDAYVG